MALLVTVFLMLINLFISFQAKAPDVRTHIYLHKNDFVQKFFSFIIQADILTALHVWLLMSMFFVAVTLMQFAVLLLLRYRANKTPKLSKIARKVINAPKKDKNFTAAQCVELDKISFKVFSFSFFLSTFFYCSVKLFFISNE